MGTDAGFHPDQARWHVGKPRLQLPARPLLPQHDRAVLILANDVERVLTDVDANHASDCTVVLAGHGVLLVFAAPCPASLAGRAGARPDHSISGLDQATHRSCGRTTLPVQGCRGFCAGEARAKYRSRARIRVNARFRSLRSARQEWPQSEAALPPARNAIWSREAPRRRCFDLLELDCKDLQAGTA